MNYEQRAAEIIADDPWMMECLQCVAELGLNDWYIGAGFVRNKLWDVLHGYRQRTPLNDVDVVFFERENADKSRDLQLEDALRRAMPEVPWSVINLASIHLRYGQAPFNDSTHAISWWPEQPTCVGVRLEPDGKLSFTAPYGLESIFELVVRPTVGNGVPERVYHERIAKKNWQAIWPNLTIER